PGGVKLTDAQEIEIEHLLPDAFEARTISLAGENGSATRAIDEYVNAALRLLAPMSLLGWRIVLDTANGATCASTPVVLRRLGADVVGLGDAPDGRNINAGVGSEH